MFNPTLETHLSIDDKDYRFSPHPAIPSMVWGQEGRHAVVFRIMRDGEAYGLKVFRPAFRHPGLIASAEGLWRYHELPGMSVCKQSVITAHGFPELVDQYEDLDYAMVMPWITGDTWFDILQNQQKITLEQSRALAESLAWTLYALELNQLAHCDLSGGNVIISPEMVNINLVDVEDLYSPWLDAPPMVPAGSIGYQHRAAARSGQWGPVGDRFSGAVLMAEILGWAHREVREAAWGESYFAPEDLQQDCPRYQTLLRALKIYHPGFAEVFQQAWYSESLETCPPIKSWYDYLDALPREPVVSWAPISQTEFAEELPEPEKKGFFGAKSVPQDSPPVQTNRAGCRWAALVALTLGLLGCCAFALAVEWSILDGLF